MSQELQSTLEAPYVANPAAPVLPTPPWVADVSALLAFVTALCSKESNLASIYQITGLAGSRGVADLRPATRDPAQNLRPATRDPVRPGPCLGHNPQTAGRRVARAIHTPCTVHHAKTMLGNSTPCTNYVRKISVYDGPACFVSSVHNKLKNVLSTNLSDDTADLFCKVCCILPPSFCHVVSRVNRLYKHCTFSSDKHKICYR